MNYYLKACEQETTVNMSREEKTAKIYTSDRRMMQKMDKLCQERPDVYQCVWVDPVIMGDGLPMGKRYQCMSKAIRFAKPRVLTEEQRKAAAEHLSQVRNGNQF